MFSGIRGKIRDKIILRLCMISRKKTESLYGKGKMDVENYLSWLQYPQAWNFIHHYPFSRRWLIIRGHYIRNPIYRMLTVFCGLLIGHEKSATEYGYGGGSFIDRNCRWCDKALKELIIESDWTLKKELASIMSEIDGNKHCSCN